QTPSLARSSGLPAAVCRPHAGQDAGDRSGAPPAFSARHLPGLRPGVRGLRVVRTLDAPGRLLCHPPALRCALPRLREAPAAATRPHLVRPNRSTGQSLVSSAFAAAPHCGGGPGVGSPAGAVDQSSGPGLDHRGPPLRRALADRGLLSRPQAEPAHQDLRRHQRQRPEDSNLDRLDRHAGAQIPATARLLWLVLIQFGRLAAAATLRLSGLVRLAQSALRTPSGFGGGPSRATPAAGRRRSLNLDSTVPTLTATCPRNRAAQPPKPIRCNITTTGPPLIWTAVVYDRRSFLLIISALIERRHSKLRHCRIAAIFDQSLYNAHVRGRIVLIEDEKDIVELVRYNLRKEAFELESFGRGRDGLEHLRRRGADLVLLDILLPDLDGFEICRKLRSDERLASTPVIFLTAKGEEFDRVLGLELGADDYIVKPFSPRELAARIKAVLRRKEPPTEKVERIQLADFSMDTGTLEVTVRGQKAELSALEFKLLHFLASHPQHVFSRERLLDA